MSSYIALCHMIFISCTRESWTIKTSYIFTRLQKYLNNFTQMSNWRNTGNYWEFRVDLHVFFSKIKPFFHFPCLFMIVYDCWCFVLVFVCMPEISGWNLLLPDTPLVDFCFLFTSHGLSLCAAHFLKIEQNMVSVVIFLHLWK